MRVGFDARWYNGSGVGTYVAEIINALTDFRDDFDLVVFEHPDNPLPIAASNVRRVPVLSSRFSLASQFEIRALCKSEQIDVFHLPYQYAAPLLLPCPLVITVHDLIPFLFRTRSWHKQMLVVPFVKLGYRAAAIRANHIIADSMNTARDAERILRISPLRITAINLAASESLFHRKAEYGAKIRNDETEKLFNKYGFHPPYAVVGSAGNWRTKNLVTALRALALGREKSGVAFQTVVYGPDEGLNAVVKRGATFGLDICRVGYLPVSDLAATFRNAELFITTSLYEGFGLPVLEAMACGCPIVTSNGGSLAEVAANGAQSFDPMDADGMAEAVAALLSQPPERERWHQRALERAAEFSWRKAAEQTLAVYKKVHDSVRNRDTITTESSAIASALRNQDPR